MPFIDPRPWCRNCNQAVDDCRCERTACLPECKGCSRHVPTMFVSCWTQRIWNRPPLFRSDRALTRKMIEDIAAELGWRK